MRVLAWGHHHFHAVRGAPPTFRKSSDSSILSASCPPQMSLNVHPGQEILIASGPSADNALTERDPNNFGGFVKTRSAAIPPRPMSRVPGGPPEAPAVVADRARVPRQPTPTGLP
jgi:hypothetical protein